MGKGLAGRTAAMGRTGEAHMASDDRQGAKTKFLALQALIPSVAPLVWPWVGQFAYNRAEG